MNTASLRVGLLGAALFLPVSGWVDSASANLPRVDGQVGRQQLRLEVAQTPEARANGLMYRRGLGRRQGMLFVFNATQRGGFWMKNTLIPLDMLFFDQAGRLQQVLPDVPPCRTTPCPVYHPAQPYRYTIELAGGAARRLGLQPGDRLVYGMPRTRQRGRPLS